MIVAGIDPSLTNTGIAILHTGAPYRLHSLGFGGRDGATYDQRSQRIVAQCRAITRYVETIVDEHDIDYPEIIVLEGPAYGHNLPSNHDRAGLWWGLYSAFRQHTNVVVIPPATLKSWATGKGNADKKLITTAVKQWWPGVRIANADIADAAALATIAAAWADDPVPFDLKDRHRNTLEGIAWPVIA